MYKGILIPNCLAFLATTAGPGLVPQQTIAWAAVPRILVSCAVMSVSFGPYVSSDIISMPNSPAFNFSCSRPEEPKPSDTVMMAIFFIFCSFMCSNILITAKASFCAVLKTHFFTGSVILIPAAQEIIGTCAFSTTGITAILFPVVLSPIIATTLSFFISRFTACTALVASP